MIVCGDALTELRKLPDDSVNMCCTSPPYWGLRDYGVAGQLGLEKTPEEYVAHLVEVFREVRRVLRSDGTLWLNLGDSYANKGCDSSSVGGFTGERIRKKLAGDNPNDSCQDSRPRDIPPGLKIKDLVGIPWRVAFALQADGWWLRQDIIWHKPNPMPESVRDRCTKAHEYIFMLSKSARYYYDAEAIREAVNPNNSGVIGGVRARTASGPLGGENKQNEIRREYDEIKGANLRSVWTIATRPYAEAHFATFPPEIPERCIKAGCPKGGTVLDPFFGAGTTGMVAMRLGREFIGIELNEKYCEMAKKRIYGELMEAHP